MSFSHESPHHITRGPLQGFILVMTVLIAVPALSALDAPHRPASSGLSRNAARANTAPGRRLPQVYLALIGPTPLRFANPRAELPPEPVMPTREDLMELPSGLDVDSTKSASTSDAAVTPDVKQDAKPQVDTNAAPEAAVGKSPLRIIPDDMRQDIRAEDVLPFFQLPAMGDNSGIDLQMSPSPARTPASSATYRQL